MSKKPKVFENQIDKTIRNNKMVFDSTKEEVVNELVLEGDDKRSDNKKNINNDLTIVDKITRLLNREGYIFNVDVSIITKDDVFKTHIARIVNNHIITLDNDIINIDDVIDIEY